MKRIQLGSAFLALLLAATVVVQPAWARLAPDDPDYKDLKALEAEQLARAQAGALPGGRRPATPMAIPDVFGPGAVLNVGNLYMKITNNGFDCNPTTTSSDPSGQWPGASSVEYFNFIAMSVGAVNRLASDPTAVRRVSYAGEWRPATLDPEDKIYRGYDGIVNGNRFINDDSDIDPLTGDARYDEDFLDGRDNDGDGRIDEDFAALGQQVYSCVMRDDTDAARNASAAERHVPLGLECRKLAWAYSIPGFTDFNVIQYDFYNRSGHVLDSLVVGFRVDMDCGPVEKGNYFSDDLDVPTYPQGNFWIQTPSTDKRLQEKGTHRDVNDVPRDSALCPRFPVTVSGFSVADDEGDDGKTPGMPHFLLIDHTIDPTGVNGPRKVGFRAFRSFVGGTPYNQGGNPTIDQQRYEFMTSVENIDPLTGFINQANGDQKGDFQAWASVGPWLNVPDGGKISVTIAAGVRPGIYRLGVGYLNEYLRVSQPYTTPLGEDARIVSDPTSLVQAYPALDNAISAQVAFEGAYEKKDWPLLPDDHGRETPVKAPPGQFLTLQGCEAHDQASRLVGDRRYEWFDFDCSYCTGAYSTSELGYFHRTWLAEAPPPSPNTNTAINYNFSDNPTRRFIPAGDQKVTLAWDNLSENTPDPKSGQFDFRGYRIWKVSNWQRPVGSGGPGENDWTLLGEFRLFSYAPDNKRPCTAQEISSGRCVSGERVCPQVYIPQTGETVDLCLQKGDLVNIQSGQIIRPDPAVLCTGYPDCVTDIADKLGRVGVKDTLTRYPIGRYRYVDTQVKNGFVYFYSVTAFDSTGQGDSKVELGSRRAAVETEGVVPQAGADSTNGSKTKVWVVPNPYRGLRRISDRPSAWDLTPNAGDPTGTHIDFYGLPRGEWTIKIFTVSGDNVVSLSSKDGVNESIRGTVTGDDGVIRPGFNRQQDNANDGQARWNLISRNGQDVVSGVYLFTVQVGTEVKQRGKFIIIR